MNAITPLSFETEPDRWAAIRRRDKRADGRFLYAVATTGVYCHPSCAARPARAENVSFHADRRSAEAAGFRACKRCKPDQPPRAEREAALVARACRMIEASEEALVLDQLAASAGLSPFHFHRMFRRVTGVTPKAYASTRRAQRVQSRLQAGARVTEAMYDAGFNSSGRFYEVAADLLGMAPARYRAGGVGEVIRHAVGRCTLGAILVAATERGVCAILLGDAPADLVADLQVRFPKAQHHPADPAFDAWVAQVVAHVDAPETALGLPLDIRGTAFQRRVWAILRDIPVGATLSYAEVAARTGSPQAVRAVAGACAANRMAVAIPCHRVVGSSGALSGYRWGARRKQALLEREALAAATACPRAGS